MKNNNFLENAIECYRTGFPYVVERYFNEEIDAWYDSNSKLELYEYLGIPIEEYAALIEGKLTLDDIIQRHIDV